MSRAVRRAFRSPSLSPAPWIRRWSSECSRSPRARCVRGRDTGAGPGCGRRARSAVGPNRGNLWRRPLSGQRDGPCRDPRIPGHELPLPADKVMVTLKHLTGHGQPRTAPMSVRRRSRRARLRENFFPPFERAVKELPVRSVMASYNEIDGVPSHANRWLLNDVLRGEWGYQGRGSQRLFRYPRADRPATRCSATSSDAAVRAIKSGVDAETPDR